MPLCLHKLTLTQFRNYGAARLDFGGAPFVVLTGANGAGKTNVLEAVSLLVPGRGLRGADLLEMKSKGADAKDVWGVTAEIETATGAAVKIGTALDHALKKRRVRIDGKEAMAQSALAEYLSALWLAPQMDRIFLEGAAGRRKFFDRMVVAYHPAHAAFLAKYDQQLRARMKLLYAERPIDPAWLCAIETDLAALSVAIGAGRIEVLSALSRHADLLARAAPLFPHPLQKMEGWVEAALHARPAVDVEAELAERFKKSREEDRARGRTQEGAQRSDWRVTYGAKDMPAAECSTGEQKALLLSIVLSHALMMRAEKGSVPLLLLDEVAAHLDAARRGQAFELMRSLGGQIFLTGTDADIFAPLLPEALALRVTAGSVLAPVLTKADHG